MQITCTHLYAIARARAHQLLVKRSLYASARKQQTHSRLDEKRIKIINIRRPACARSMERARRANTYVLVRAAEHITCATCAVFAARGHRELLSNAISPGFLLSLSVTHHTTNLVFFSSRLNNFATPTLHVDCARGQRKYIYVYFNI